MAPNQQPPSDEAHRQQQPATVAPSRFLIGQDGEPMLTVQPDETIVRIFSSRPSLGDAGFIRTGGGKFVHRHLDGNRP